jgi:acetyl esterase
MTLDPSTEALLQGMAEAGGPALHELPVDLARAAIKELSAKTGIAAADVHQVEDRGIPGPNGVIPIRIYRPGARTADPSLPALILYHGGGWILGDIESHDSIARYLCRHGAVVVVNVEYRLAPEHKFPAGVEDCYAVLEWVAGNAGELGIDPGRIALTGDSAGGNLTVVASLLARERNGPAVAFQIPAYPCVDCREQAGYPSRGKFGGGEYFLSSDDITWVNRNYFTTSRDAEDVRASPILIGDLAGLPPALVITAGYDPLCDEGEHYARRLRAAGVPVEYQCYTGTIHGFLSFAGVLKAGRDALDLVAARLRTGFGPQV